MRQFARLPKDRTSWLKLWAFALLPLFPTQPNSHSGYAVVLESGILLPPVWRFISSLPLVWCTAPNNKRVAYSSDRHRYGFGLRFWFCESLTNWRHCTRGVRSIENQNQKHKHSVRNPASPTDREAPRYVNPER